ncbi:MAG: DNA/RNA non-specific endonuclease [Muribaculaceae bacterium]|nr:DNA/RNA non-specific endonuclease [Muribaculaceae bacterium]
MSTQRPSSPASRRSRRTSARRRPNNGSGLSWKLTVAALLLVAVFFAVRAYRSSRSADSTAAVSRENAMTTSAGVHHYPDLEIAGYTDPSEAAGKHRKDYEGFTLSFNRSNGTPDWVGWELLGSETEGDVQRKNNFWADRDVPGSPTPDDYRNSGYDKGHLCPAADQKWSDRAMTDCFVMTNMTPQTHALNGGAWNTLEGKERIWAKRDSALIIVAGPIYAETDTERIGKSGVRVPSAFFKVLLAPYVKEPRAIGFVYPNMAAPGNMQNYAMSVDEVEELTGLDFFSTLPDDLEQRIESRTSFTEWNRR